MKWLVNTGFSLKRFRNANAEDYDECRLWIETLFSSERDPQFLCLYNKIWNG